MQFPIKTGNYLPAERGYWTAQGLRHVAWAGGRVTVRVNTDSLCWKRLMGSRLLAGVRTLRRVSLISAGDVRVVEAAGVAATGRACAIRKTQ